MKTHHCRGSGCRGAGDTLIIITILHPPTIAQAKSGPHRRPYSDLVINMEILATPLLAHPRHMTKSTKTNSNVQPSLRPRQLLNM